MTQIYIRILPKKGHVLVQISPENLTFLTTQNILLICEKDGKKGKVGKILQKIFFHGNLLLAIGILMASKLAQTNVSLSSSLIQSSNAFLDTMLHVRLS